MCVREGERECVCVCVRERESASVRVCVHVPVPYVQWAVLESLLHLLPRPPRPLRHRLEREGLVVDLEVVTAEGRMEGEWRENEPDHGKGGKRMSQTTARREG